MVLPAVGSPLQLWGGLECSVVRVDDAWRDQIKETGHHDRRASDFDLVASLGIRTLRYPITWERVTADHEAGQGWAWHDEQLEALHARGMDVVAGLLHHGSGPPETSFLDPLFPEKLAAHAARAAARYPDVAAWVPVNEPLTTARFSCLYGHWYPHLRDEGAFLRALVMQARAALLAMRAIRRRLPAACFVHTEDIGRVFATLPLADQAAYENERRWLSLDLLCGQVDRAHPWRERLEAHGVPAADLDELASGEAAPDLIGVNHYVTSDRFLDHRVKLYPPAMRGGNGRQAYADTEAVRMDLDPRWLGWEPRLWEVWERYQRPIALTEAHLGCDDAREQVLWLLEAWQAARTLRERGADIRAVTAWALFGLVDWHVLLRERLGRLEPGALDMRRTDPLAGALAQTIAALAGGRAVPPAGEGWWRRNDRLTGERRAS